MEMLFLFQQRAVTLLRVFSLVELVRRDVAVLIVWLIEHFSQGSTSRLWFVLARFRKDESDAGGCILSGLIFTMLIALKLLLSVIAYIITIFLPCLTLKHVVKVVQSVFGILWRFDSAISHLLITLVCLISLWLEVVISLVQDIAHVATVLPPLILYVLLALIFQLEVVLECLVGRLSWDAALVIEIELRLIDHFFRVSAIIIWFAIYNGLLLLIIWWSLISNLTFTRTVFIPLASIAYLCTCLLLGSRLLELIPGWKVFPALEVLTITLCIPGNFVFARLASLNSLFHSDLLGNPLLHEHVEGPLLS